MITENDIKKISLAISNDLQKDLKNFVTKSDLKEFASKKDIDVIRDMQKGMATKNDISVLRTEMTVNTKNIKEIRSEMATKKDIKDIRSEMATKKDLKFSISLVRSEINDLKDDVNSLRESVQALTIAVDCLAKSVTDLKDEYTLINEKLRRHEKWIQEIAEKVGVKLDY